MIFTTALFVGFMLIGFYTLGYAAAHANYINIATDAQKNAVEALLIADEYKTAYAQLEKERSPSKD